MNKKELLPHLAITSIRKNSATYLPYFGISIFAMFTFFVFDIILNNDIVTTLPRAAYATMLLSIGKVLLGLIMVPFLYYTNSFLIKRRKKELGLYSILGMEKKHIGVMMLYETLITYCVVVICALFLGVLFSRLIFLVLLNLAKLPVHVSFGVSAKASPGTMLLFGIISLVNLSVNLFQVGKANPVELMSSAKAGEKEPKLIWLWSAMGVSTLAGGYIIALKTKVNSDIFNNFFLAIIFVTMGTYFLFTSGSIQLLRSMKRKKLFYYRPENFITISGMLYRMKKNAAGLVNICLFSTMVIITVMCTVSMYLGIPKIIAFRFPHRIQIEFMEAAGFDEKESVSVSVAQIADQCGLELVDYQDYSYVHCVGMPEENGIARDTGGPYDKKYDIDLLTVEDYNLLSGEHYALQEGEVLLYTAGPDYGKGEIQLAGLSFFVKEELRHSTLFAKAEGNTFGGHYAVILADTLKLSETALAYGVDSTLSSVCRVEMNIDGEEAQILSFVAQLQDVVSAMPGFAGMTDYKEAMENAESMYGGLLFIGIIFGLNFMICLLITMYYKQITEGFEDRNSFEIMQKVGMEDSEVQKTIRRQVSMIFYLPMAGALLHTAMGTNMVIHLMGGINLFAPELIRWSAVGVSILFVLLYTICYHRTARTYYRIVSMGVTG